MNQLLKKSLLFAIGIALIVDALVVFCSLNSCTIFGGSESLIYYPAYVITYFFGGSLLGLDGKLTSVDTNLFFLLIEILYLFIIIFLIGSTFLLIKNIIPNNIKSEISETVITMKSFSRNLKFQISIIIVILLIIYFLHIINWKYEVERKKQNNLSEQFKEAFEKDILNSKFEEENNLSEQFKQAIEKEETKN